MQSKIKSYIKIVYPWLVWFLAASFFYYKYLIQVSPGVMSSDLMRAYNLSGTGLGNLAACFFYGYLLMQIPVGIILDKWSPGKITALACFVCSLATYAFAQTNSVFGAGICRFVIGLSVSFAAVGCFKLASIWFPPRRFAVVAGLSMTMGMCGAIGGQRPLAQLVGSFGWRSSLEILAAAGLFLAFSIFLLIGEKQPIAATHAEKNELKLKQKLSVLLKDKQTWLLSVYSGLAFAPVSVFGGLWGVSFLQNAYNLPNADAASFISLIFLGFAIGCPITGWFSDYIGRRKPLMVAGTILSLLSLYCLLFFPLSTYSLECMLFIFGLGASCFFLCFSMIRELHPIVFTATVLGFMNTFDSVCEAVTEPFIGWLLDLLWQGDYANGARAFSLNAYHLGLSALVVYLSVGLVLLLFIKETYCQQTETMRLKLASN